MAKKAVGGLVAKLGMKARQAVEAHKNDEMKLSGGGDLPAGIENGVAQLVTCKFGVYEKGDMKGEYYFMASGIVVSPKTLRVDGNVIPVGGLRTTIGPEPICETPNRSRKTIEDHIAWVMNEMRKLGVDTSELSADDLEATAAALEEQGPHFRFRTWAGEPTKDYPNPRTNHDWRGTVEDFNADDVPESEDEELIDNTEEAEDTEEAEEVEETEAVEEETDWLEVAKAADKDDEESATMLQEKALEVGIKQSVIDKTPKWSVIAKMIIEKLGASEETEAEEAEEAVDYDALGASADEADQDAIATLTEKAEGHGLDPDDYPSWAELATAIAELEAGGGAEEGSEEVEAEEGEEAEEDLAALGASADEGDQDAINRLTELAGEAEYNTDDYETWAELAEVLATPTEEEGEEEAEEEFIPAVKEVYHYKPKGAKKPIEVEVKSVGKGKVTLLNLTDKKTLFKDVPFSELINE